eukprot:tig00001093_g6893.t1
MGPKRRLSQEKVAAELEDAPANAADAPNPATKPEREPEPEDEPVAAASVEPERSAPVAETAEPPVETAAAVAAKLDAPTAPANVLGDDAPRKSYNVSVFTGDVQGAGTDANVSIALLGTLGRTPRLVLDKEMSGRAKSDMFEGFQIDRFKLETSDVGELRAVVVEHDNSGLGPGWFLDYVEVEPEGWEGPPLHFPCARWLAKDEDDGLICRELPVEAEPADEAPPEAPSLAAPREEGPAEGPAAEAVVGEAAPVVIRRVGRAQRRLSDAFGMGADAARAAAESAALVAAALSAQARPARRLGPTPWGPDPCRRRGRRWSAPAPASPTARTGSAGAGAGVGAVAGGAGAGAGGAGKGGVPLSKALLGEHGEFVDPTVQVPRLYWGELRVTVVEAEQLEALDLLGTSDPYYVIHFEREPIKGEVKMETLNPVWNTEHVLPVTEPMGTLAVELWDWDKIGGHDLMGIVRVPLWDLFDEASHDRWYEINDKERWRRNEVQSASTIAGFKFRGRLRLRLQLRVDKKAYYLAHVANPVLPDRNDPRLALHEERYSSVQLSLITQNFKQIGAAFPDPAPLAAFVRKLEPSLQWRNKPGALLICLVWVFLSLHLHWIPPLLPLALAAGMASNYLKKRSRVKLLEKRQRALQEKRRASLPAAEKAELEKLTGARPRLEKRSELEFAAPPPSEDDLAEAAEAAAVKEAKKADDFRVLYDFYGRIQGQILAVQRMTSDAVTLIDRLGKLARWQVEWMSLAIFVILLVATLVLALVPLSFLIAGGGVFVLTAPLRDANVPPANFLGRVPARGPEIAWSRYEEVAPEAKPPADPKLLADSRRRALYESKKAK